MLSVSIDKEKIILAMAVNTYIDNASDKVIFNITYNTLPEGTQYAGKLRWMQVRKNGKIVIENSGYAERAGH
jgi:hypothetical protein